MSHTTIEFTLPVLTIMGQAIMGIALSMLPITITMITLPLVIQSATWPLLLRGPTKLAFNSSNWAAEKGRQWSSADVLVPLTILCHRGFVKGVSSGPSSHCGSLGFSQHTHSKIAVSLSLKITSSILSQGISGISNSFPVGHLLRNATANQLNKLTSLTV